jgi:hypothetical protein
MSQSTHFARLEPLHLEGFQIEAEPPARVKLSGMIASREPDAAIASYIRRIHEAIVLDKLPRLDVDIREVTFVNSSGLRVFVDWALAARGGDAGKPAYRIRFTTDNKITWQRMSLVALQSIAEDVIEIEAA